jgi:predicted N-acetyltransferase YhbS
VTPRVTVRAARDGDLAGIGALQRYVEPEMRRSPEEFAELWRWMYRDTPFARSFAVVGEDEQGAVVGHEGIMPFDLSVYGEPLRGGITCNLIVAEPLRGTLLYPRLVSAMLKGYPGAGFEAGYGPARPKMLQSLLAFGYRDLGQIPVWVRPYGFAEIAAHYVRSPALRAALASPLWLARQAANRFGPRGGAGIAVEPVERFGEDARAPLAAALAPPLWLARQAANRFGPRGGAGIAVEPVERFGEDARAPLAAALAPFPVHAVRTPEILNWRYFAAPRRRYAVYRATAGGRFAGYVALRRMPMLGFDALALVDVVFPPDRPEIGRALLACAHREARAQGVAFAACMTSGNAALLRLLRRAGFVRAPEGFGMIVHEPKGAPPRFPDGVLRDWFVSWFDHDYV